MIAPAPNWTDEDAVITVPLNTDDDAIVTGPATTTQKMLAEYAAFTSVMTAAVITNWPVVTTTTNTACGSLLASNVSAENWTNDDVRQVTPGVIVPGLDPEDEPQTSWFGADVATSAMRFKHAWERAGDDVMAVRVLVRPVGAYRYDGIDREPARGSMSITVECVDCSSDPITAIPSHAVKSKGKVAVGEYLYTDWHMLVVADMLTDMVPIPYARQRSPMHAHWSAPMSVFCVYPLSHASWHVVPTGIGLVHVPCAPLGIGGESNVHTAVDERSMHQDSG